MNDIAEQIDAQKVADTPRVHRPHLGASQIGNPCNRALWYGLHWADSPKFPGRILRLFDRGQREEEVAIKHLRSIGCRITGQQKRLSDLDGIFSGSCDGIISRVPGYRNTDMILEIKTHNNKSFSNLQKKGVEKSKPLHYAQMQCYIKWSSLKRSLYYAINKDNDEIYTEIIEYAGDAYYNSLKAKAKSIIDADTPPERISDDSNNFNCRFCDFKDVCHNKKIADVNCRTCVHSTIVKDCHAQCRRHNVQIPYEKQLVSEQCPTHLLNPALVPYKQIDAGDDYIEYKAEDTVIRNSESGDFPSVQFRVINPKLLDDEYIAEIQNRFEITFTEDIE